MKIRNAFVSTFSLILLFGCATPVPKKELSREEITRQEILLGTELARGFELHLQLKSDSALTRYLGTIAQRLVGASPELPGADAHVMLIQPRKGKWANYILPGNRVYLCVDLLKQMEFENEIAAMMALELGHISTHHISNRITDSQNVKYFGPEGIFSFSDEEEIDAAKEAVGILYRAGYDPRGLISVLENFRKHPNQSPYESEFIRELLEQGRHEIAAHAPLRNPIVQSKDFLLVQKRIRKL